MTNTPPAPDRLEQTRRARGLVSSRKSGARIEAARIEPARDLQELVETFWTGAWDLRGQVPHTTELIGDPCPHVVYEWNAVGPSARVVGPWSGLWRRTLQDSGHVLGIKLRAGAGTSVLPRPLHLLRDRIVPLASLLPSAPRQHEILQADGPRPDAFERLSGWLRTSARPTSEHRRACAAFDRIRADPDLTSVEELAERVGESLRALQRLFRDHVGLSPKRVIRRHRLQEAAVRLEAGTHVSLADLAVELGYSDQAHLTRDFKAMVGKTPADFRVAVHR